jgi:membrane protein implicated in regulation of membrane protease activity
MTPRTRSRLLWLLAALTAAHALASVAVFAVTGTFSPTALTLSVVVYAFLLVCAFVLLATSPRRRLRRISIEKREPMPETRIVLEEPSMAQASPVDAPRAEPA